MTMNNDNQKAVNCETYSRASKQQDDDDRSLRRHRYCQYSLSLVKLDMYTEFLLVDEVPTYYGVCVSNLFAMITVAKEIKTSRIQSSLPKA